MEKTSEYLYRRLYNHFKSFCMTGDEKTKDFILDMELDIHNGRETTLTNMYELIKEVIEMNKGEFCNSWNIYSGSFSKDKENWWYANNVLTLVYEYIFHDLKMKEKCRQESEKIFAEINKDRKALGQPELSPLGLGAAEYVIDNHIKKRKTMKTEYAKKEKQDNFRLKQRSYMKILKGFSSSTPFFYDALVERFQNNPIKGGGFFIKWKDHGIVIDPGINFIENFHLAGLTISDITTIIITHNHIDHCGDLQTIDDLASQMQPSDIDIYMDEDTYMKFKITSESSCFRKHLLDSSNENVIKIGCEPEKILVEYFETEHVKNEKDHTKYKKGCSYGLKLCLFSHGVQMLSIGVTSDTRYMEMLPKIFQNCDYVIANFSETKQEDYENRIEKEEHLGYTGCYRLITECNAVSDRKKPLYIISEFWGGLGDIRKEIVSSLRKECGYEKIIPGDIGMTFMLDNATFLCDFCQKETDLKKMRIVKQKGDFSKIELICKDCILE